MDTALGPCQTHYSPASEERMKILREAIICPVHGNYTAQCLLTKSSLLYKNVLYCYWALWSLCQSRFVTSELMVRTVTVPHIILWLTSLTYTLTHTHIFIYVYIPRSRAPSELLEPDERKGERGWGPALLGVRTNNYSITSFNINIEWNYYPLCSCQIKAGEFLPKAKPHV